MMELHPFSDDPWEDITSIRAGQREEESNGLPRGLLVESREKMTDDGLRCCCGNSHAAIATLLSQQRFVFADGKIWHLKIFEFTGCYFL